MNFYNILKHTHSGFRYIVFILLIIAIIQSILGWLNKSGYSEGNRKINLFTLISAHIQLLIGIVLYFISPLVQFNSDTMKNPTTRYFTVEHWVIMLLAIILITIGYSKSKKTVLPENKHKIVTIYYAIAFLVIVVAIIAGHLPFFGSRA